jgi:hypothetical protein
VPFYLLAIQILVRPGLCTKWSYQHKIHTATTSVILLQADQHSLKEHHPNLKPLPIVILPQDCTINHLILQQLAVVKVAIFGYGVILNRLSEWVVVVRNIISQ